MEPDPLSPYFTTEVIGFIIALLGCALFSFLETSVTALRLFKLKEIAGSTTRYKTLLQTLETHPHQVLISILIANSLVNVTAAALITDIMEKLFASLQLSSGLGFSMGIAVGSISILLFGEVIPKNIAKIHGERFFKSTLWITNFTFYALNPLVNFLTNFANIFVRLVGGTTEPTESVTSEREIRFLINYTSEKGLIETEKTEMLQSIFNMGLKQVVEIMIPSDDVITIEANKSLDEALNIFAKYQYSRLPVYEDSKDNIIGMLYQKDIFNFLHKKENKELKDLLRPILFVPESMKINQLLRELKQQHMHIAMVLNEYGSITGLVTLEDVLEEIVGEIRDEYESANEKIVELEPGNWLCDAGVDLDTIAGILKIKFVVEDVVTLGGFITEQLQHVPKKGERVEYAGYFFQVQKASPKRVSQVLIFKDTIHNESDRA